MIKARHKKVLAILIPASALLAWRVVAMVGRVSPAPAEAMPRAGESAAPEAMSGLGLEAVEWAGIQRRQEEARRLAWGRDPFGTEQPAEVQVSESSESTEALPPPAAPVPNPPEIRLSGVSQSGGQYLAAIGGEILRVGDLVADGFRVQGITNQSMTLEKQGWLLRYDVGSETPVVSAAGSGGNP